MTTLTFSDLINKTIESVRFTYNRENEYDLQEFHSYIKLSDGIIFEFPANDKEWCLLLSNENNKFLRGCFEEGNEVFQLAKSIIEGQRILDIYFHYRNGETDIFEKAYIKLSNGYYITEINFGPQGLTDIDLLILNEDQWKERHKNLNQTLKSYVNDISADVPLF